MSSSHASRWKAEVLAGAAAAAAQNVNEADEGEIEEVEDEQKMAIVREWLVALPSFSPGRVLTTAATARRGSRRPPTASYARRDTGKADALIRLTSSKRRTSTTVSAKASVARMLSKHRRQQQLHQQMKSMAAQAAKDEPAEDKGGGRSYTRRSQEVRTIPQQREEEPAQPQQPQPRHMYSQTARPVNATPRWLQLHQSAAAASARKSSTSQSRQRSRSLEAGAQGNSPRSLQQQQQKTRSAWGSASNLLAGQSNSSLDTSGGTQAAAGSPRAAGSATVRGGRYERMARPKPLHESRGESPAAAAMVAAAGHRESRTARRTSQQQPLPMQPRQTSVVRVVAEVPLLTEALGGEEADEMQQQQQQQQQQQRAQPLHQQIDFRLLREIGQRRPKTAFEATVESRETTTASHPMPASTESGKQQRRPATTAPQAPSEPGCPSEHTFGSPGRLPHHHLEPETAVGYFIKREQLSARQEQRRRLQQQQQQQQQQETQASSDRGDLTGAAKASSTNSAANTNQQQLPTDRRSQVVQPHLTTATTTGDSAVVKPATPRVERKPVNYGYNWLQEFNKMSITEAEIERRVKNGGKLRNSASQTTRFELPFDLTELESMDPKHYLRQYTVVSSRRLYLYQKVFQKYKTPTLNAVEIKDLSKCITDIIVGGISDDRLDEMLELTNLKEAGQLDSKLFYAFCAVVERQTTGKKLPDDPSELMECHKQRLESADFIGLSYKFKGVKLSAEMSRLLTAL